MAQFCMPMVIINMGGEMVYILAQRLMAQNVPADKSKRGRRLPCQAASVAEPLHPSFQRARCDDVSPRAQCCTT